MMYGSIYRAHLFYISSRAAAASATPEKRDIQFQTFDGHKTKHRVTKQADAGALGADEARLRMTANESIGKLSNENGRAALVRRHVQVSCSISLVP